MSESWQDILLAYFRTHRRELPWREEPRDPYAVWVSEIMLQQTRAEAVRPYFEAWRTRFPTVEALAAADEAEVLHAWQGLGYYSRARNLHRAAKEMMERYGGRLPSEKEELLTLPGIGEYTAGAIASFAYGKQTAAVDGNVLRIYARLYGIEEDILKNATKKRITSLVEDTLPTEAGAFNETLMDFGSGICIPKHPRCEHCPLQAHCQAFSTGKEGELPYRSKKKPKREEHIACAIIIREGAVFLQLRPPKGLLASMWEFPSATGSDGTEARERLEASCHGKVTDLVWTHTHVFTHRIWHMRAYLMTACSTGAGEWFTADGYSHIPLAGPHARLAAKVSDLLCQDF